MKGRIEILSQLHDAVYFQAPISKSDAEEQELLRECIDCIEVEQTTTRNGGRKMKIPGDIVGGFNWAHRFRFGGKDDWNPKGLDGIRIAA
jgi:hypothetical protein